MKCKKNVKNRNRILYSGAVGVKKLTYTNCIYTMEEREEKAKEILIMNPNLENK